ncbi:MAG TPA: radical SAM protein [Alphaproteobacteria bacterium]|nr:radical SAM protein [Alphaproteobacteria bacterium]
MIASVYSALKPFRYPDRIEALSEGRVAAPAHVRIKPTNVCNHDCYFCAYRSGNVSLGEGMVVRDRIPREKMMEIIDDLIAMGVQAVTFSGGGEPLIYPHFAEAVRRLGEGGLRIGSLSNGSRLLGKAADALAEFGTWVRISIDGWDDESYARYRSVKPGEFARVLANMEAFAARGSVCTLGTSIIVDKDNAGHILELCRQLKNVGARHAKISPCIVSDSGEETNAYHQAFAATVHEQIGLAREALQDDGFQVVDHYHAMPESYDKPYRSCPMTRMLTVIGADCTVYMCQDRAYRPSGALGSLRDISFRELWYSDALRQRLDGLDPSVHCRHHCVADTKNRMLSDLLAQDPAHLPFV